MDTISEFDTIDETIINPDNEEMARLEALKASECSPNASRPDRLGIDRITVIDLFRPRDGDSEFHLSQIVRALAISGDLEPITVYQCGTEIFLIDGLTRLEAYGEAKRADGVPVTFFEGTPREALLEAYRVNSRPTLPLSNEERQNGAWRLVKMQAFTLPQIITNTGVSRSQVTIMRKVLKDLGEEAFECRRWAAAKMKAKGRNQIDLTEEEREMELEEQANNDADLMARTFSKVLANDEERMARMLELYMGRRFEGLSRTMWDRCRDPWETDEEKESGEDF